MNEEKVTNRLHRDNSTKSMYDELKNRLGPLYKKNHRDIFLLSLAVGYKNNMYISLDKSNNEAFIRDESYGRILPVLIKALAITKSKEGINVLTKDPTEINSYAEKYANGGITYLYEEYKKNNDFINKLAMDIIKHEKELKIIEKINNLNK